MSVQLIRIGNVTVSVGNLYKVLLDEKNSQVLVYVKGRAEPFGFAEPSAEKAENLYVNLCRLVQTTQHIVPFLFFANVAVRLELLTAIHTEGDKILLSTSGHEPEVFAFANEAEARSTFDALMNSLGIGVTDEAAQAAVEPDLEAKNKPQSKNKKTPRERAPQKIPEKVPRKRGRSVEATKH